MQPVNDNMDHLFRQAANDYPLNTQGADFDKLQQRMQPEESEVPTKKEHRRRFAWLLLLLIALPFICQHQDNYMMGENGGLTTQHTGTNNRLTTQDLPDQKRIATQGDSSSLKLTVDNNTPAIESKKTVLPPTPPAQEDLVSKKTDSTRQSLKTTNDDNTGSNGLLGSKKLSTEKIHPNNTQAIISKKKKRQNSNSKLRESVNTDPSQDIAILKSGKAVSQKGNIDTITGQDFNTFKKDTITKATSTDSTQTAQQQPDTAAAAIVKKVAQKDSSTQDTTAQKKKLKEKEVEKAHLYAGIVAGPDYSVVKSSRTGGTGYNAGLVAGYRFGKHWAVETGLLWNYKKYFAEGKYVSVEKLALLSHTEVMNADGSCGMFEIPLTVQYHFSSKSKGHWYAAAGLSSYLMKKEEYYYLYKRYNMQYYSEKEYINSTNNWFSVLQLGGGYQLKIGKQSSIRVEPYTKLPISGIGIAKLPLSSTGINIGYMMSF